MQLIQAKKGRREKTASEEQSWENADRGLFDRLREWRREIASKRGMPPFVILHDSVLQTLSIIRPTRLETLRAVRGLGEKKLADFGAELNTLIEAYCREHDVTRDVTSSASSVAAPPPSTPRVNPSRDRAFQLFAQGLDIDQVSQAIGRARSTTSGYLAEYITEQRPEQIDAWVDKLTYDRVAAVAVNSEDGRLKPLFDQLNGEVHYDLLRLVVRICKQPARREGSLVNDGRREDLGIDSLDFVELIMELEEDM